MKILSTQQKQDLTDTLSKCQCISSQNERDAFVRALPEWRIYIRRDPMPRNDVRNIITTSLLHFHGLEDLIDLVREFEGRSALILLEIESIFVIDPPKIDPPPGRHEKESNSPREPLEVLPKALRFRYLILNVLHDSDDAIGYIAYDYTLDQSVTINVRYLRQPEKIKQFTDQAKFMMQLSDAHLPKVYSYYVDEQACYLVTEYVDGTDLWQILQSEKRLDSYDALSYILQICEAVQYLHEQNPPVVHLGIAPQNIRITNQQARLASFYPSVTAAIIPGYSPMELHGGNEHTTAASDIYALGATLYTLLTGITPPESKERIPIDNYVPLVKSNLNINRSLCTLVDHALERNKNNRPQSVLEWSAAIKNMLDHESKQYHDLCLPLEDLLVAGKWQDADNATSALLVILAKQTGLGSISAGISNIPSIALRTIDELWQGYSDGQFGLQVQRQIWQGLVERATSEGRGMETRLSAERVFAEFGNQVGWCTTTGQFSGYLGFTFSLDALTGHLPSLRDTISKSDPGWFQRWKANVMALLLR